MKTLWAKPVSPVVLGLTLAIHTQAVDRNYFIGNWLNSDKKTGGIKARQIGLQDNRPLMRAWGACTPDPCKWGFSRASLLSGSVSSTDVSAAIAVFKTTFAVTRLTMHPGAQGALTVEVMTHFTDNGGDPNITDTEVFHSVSWDARNSNIFR
jgi:hypothetical protein